MTFPYAGYAGLANHLPEFQKTCKAQNEGRESPEKGLLHGHAEALTGSELECRFERMEDDLQETRCLR